jgi:predicted nucleotidyltransferase
MGRHGAGFMLKGKNRIKEFRRIAQEIAKRVSMCKGVAGVVFVGGLVRGFADRFSDVDVTVFLDQKNQALKKNVNRIGAEASKRSGVDVDLEVNFLEDFRRRKWSEIERWDYSRAKIVFDKSGKTSRLLWEKSRIPRDFWVRRIAVYSEYVRWYCCAAIQAEGTVSEAWSARGDLVSAHYCLNYSVEMVVKVLFALNREFTPPPKWLLYYSYDLKWKPAEYKTLLGEALVVKDFSKRELNRRLIAIKRLWMSVLSKIQEELGMSSAQLGKYFFQVASGSKKRCT